MDEELGSRSQILHRYIVPHLRLQFPALNEISSGPIPGISWDEDFTSYKFNTPQREEITMSAYSTAQHTAVPPTFGTSRNGYSPSPTSLRT